MTRFFPNVCTWPENWDLKWDNFLHTYLHRKARKAKKKRAWKILYVHFLKIVQLWAHTTPLAVQLLGSYLHHELRFEVRQFSEYLHRNAIMKAAFNETLSWHSTILYRGSPLSANSLSTIPVLHCKYIHWKYNETANSCIKCNETATTKYKFLLVNLAMDV